ncbi:MAG: YhbY family RNA-binding protein [bacterium]
MNRLNPAQLRAKRSAANAITVTMHVGKNGVNDAAILELKAQLHKHKLVKVRLLPSATDGGVGNEAQADALAAGADAQLVEIRGHTAVFWRA